jgi:hypothetical protein
MRLERESSDRIMMKTIRTTSSIWLWIFALISLCSAAQRGGEGAKEGEQFLATWIGTWDGAGTGTFELTLEKGSDAALGGRVSVTGEPTYKATLKTVSFEGKKMTARYDFPPDDRAEVVLVGTFDGDKATGTWSLHEKGGSSEAASGTWTVTRR